MLLIGGEMEEGAGVEGREKGTRHGFWVVIIDQRSDGSALILPASNQHVHILLTR